MALYYKPNVKNLIGISEPSEKKASGLASALLAAARSHGMSLKLTFLVVVQC